MSDKRAETLREVLWEVLEKVTTAEWNLQQCSDDCNDRSRALDRLAEASGIIEKAIGGEK